MSQLQMQQLQVDNETKMAYSRSQDGLAQERLAKIQSDKAVNIEKISRSEEEKTAGLLNVLKALKELQGIDLTHIEQSLNILHSIEASETNQQQETKRAL
jgi:ribosome-binding protein aMBF1 (putative translation factor)